MHKFHLRQHVLLVGQHGKTLPGTAFEVIRLMPPGQNGEPTYRIKSAAGERAVREGEINLLR